MPTTFVYRWIARRWWHTCKFVTENQPPMASTRLRRHRSCCCDSPQDPHDATHEADRIFRISMAMSDSRPTMWVFYNTIPGTSRGRSLRSGGTPGSPFPSATAAEHWISSAPRLVRTVATSVYVLREVQMSLPFASFRHEPLSNMLAFSCLRRRPGSACMQLAPDTVPQRLLLDTDREPAILMTTAP